MKRNILFATAALLSATAFAAAQTTQSAGTSQAKPSAYGSSYGSQYSGVAHPSDAAILANAAESTAPAPVAVQAAPAPAPTYLAPAAAAPATPAQNPDYGIVETPVREDAPAVATANAYASTTTPTLRNHVNDPDYGIVTDVAGDPNQLPQGTPFHARLVEEISADTIAPGTPFTAQLTRDVVHMGNVVIPTGSYIHGRVTYVSSGRRIGGQSTMRLTPQEVVLPDGTHYQFRGIVTQTAGSNTKADSEGYVIDKGHPVRTASEYGMTAGSGAVIGAVVGGPVGAGQSAA